MATADTPIHKRRKGRPINYWSIKILISNQINVRSFLISNHSHSCSRVIVHGSWLWTLGSSLLESSILFLEKYPLFALHSLLRFFWVVFIVFKIQYNFEDSTGLFTILHFVSFSQNWQCLCEYNSLNDSVGLLLILLRFTTVDKIMYLFKIIPFCFGFCSCCWVS